MARTYLTDEPVPTGPLLFLRSIRKVAERPPLWLITWSMIALTALPVGVVWNTWFRDAVAHRYQPDVASEAGDRFAWDDIAYSLTASFTNDHAEGLSNLNKATANLGAVLAFTALLLGVFAAGGWLQVILERTHGHALRRFFLGGARYFWRFLRLLLLSAVLLALWKKLIYGDVWDKYVLGGLFGVPESDWGSLENLDSEWGMRRLEWLRDGCHAAGFALVLAWGTFARTRMALLDGSSVLKAGFLTGFAILFHPIKTLRPLMSIFLVELVLVTLLLGWVTRSLEGVLEASPSQGVVVAMLVVGLVGLMVREILRGARYHASVKVSQEIVRRPAQQPDPWRAVGGPGGPQYPVGEGEGETYVSL
jgi:hypothetical protein